MSNLDLIAHLCSRLCHDLVGPIGALGNGIEILSEEQDESMRQEATQLLEASVIEATKRLQYFRMAFGALGGLHDKISSLEVRRTAEDFFSQGRTRLHWKDVTLLPVELSKNTAKLLLNLLLVAQTTLPRGGDLAVYIEQSGLAISAAGTGGRLAPEIQAALAEHSPPLDSHIAIPVYARLLADALGGILKIENSTTGQVTFRYHGVIQ